MKMVPPSSHYSWNKALHNWDKWSNSSKWRQTLWDRRQTPLSMCQKTGKSQSKPTGPLICSCKAVENEWWISLSSDKPVRVFHMHNLLVMSHVLLPQSQ